MNDYRRERYNVTEGYAVGTTDGGEWLTVLGSHWATIPLFETPEMAEEWFDAKWRGEVPTGKPYVTRKVRRAGTYFEVIA
jgi:hypothetical protein